jgi:hypothetical protein
MTEEELETIRAAKAKRDATKTQHAEEAVRSAVAQEEEKARTKQAINRFTTAGQEAFIKASTDGVAALGAGYRAQISTPTPLNGSGPILAALQMQVMSTVDKVPNTALQIELHQGLVIRARQGRASGQPGGAPVPADAKNFSVNASSLDLWGEMEAGRIVSAYIAWLMSIQID